MSVYSAVMVYTKSVNFRSPATDNAAREPIGRPGHVLLVNYFFPPMTGGGIPRPVKMAKYLHRAGWKVTILTVRATGPTDQLLDVAGSAEVVRVREWPAGPLLSCADQCVRLLRRGWERLSPRDTSLLDWGFVYEEHEIAASKIGWVAPGVRAALRIHRRDPVDVAIASIPPGAAGAIGWALRRLRGVPYLVEYRDPWTVGAFWTADARGRARNDPVTRTRFALTSRLEAGMLRRAAGAIIVNGEGHVQRLKASFPAETGGKPVVRLPNGIDLEDVRRLPAATGRPALRLLHTGFFYHFYTPHHVISALRLVRRDNPECLLGLELEFMGDGFPAELKRQAREWGLADLLRFTPPGTYSQALAASCSADALLVMLPPLGSDRERLPTKLYEYLATDRPILAVVHPDGAAARLLAGVPDALVADTGDEAAIAAGLVAIIRLASRRRTEPARFAPGQRGQPHHYQDRAAQLHDFLCSMLAGG